MKLKSVVVHGLFGRKAIDRFKFKPDLNIITGRNGSGKTTIMKLIWYIISGQIVKALVEIDFSRVVVETDIYTITVFRTGPNTCRIKWLSDNKETEYQDGGFDEDGDFANAEDEPDRMMRSLGTSIFFPTFRRIEGGFTSSQRPRRGLAIRTVDETSELEAALNSISTKLSGFNHKFISALSTSDIEKLLLKQYTEASEDANRIQHETSSKIIDQIKEYKQDKYEATPTSPVPPAAAEEALDNIRTMIEDMDRQRVLALSQYNAIRDLVLRIFAHGGIQVGRLSIGDAAMAVSSDALSAGEKQMLSFLCYNAFYNNGIIFIDEPELSLHIDWQRQLFPTLFSQRKENQFIIATHSPFIYSRYPQNEISLHSDRGNTEDVL